MWFYEHRKGGKWWPVVVPDQPTVVSVAGKTRLKGVNGLGREVRAVRVIQQCLEHLTLDQLAAVYGADGHLQATAREGAAQ